MADPVGVVFYCRDSREMFSTALKTPTGGAAGDQLLKTRCNDAAIDGGYSHWAQYSMAQRDWVIFRFPKSEPWTTASRVAQFARRMPTRESAEMWMLHDDE